MIGPIDFPALGGGAADVWPILFDLAEEFPDSWALVGAQMVVLHALAYGVSRPSYTADADVLVNVRSLRTRQVAEYLESKGFVLAGVSADGVGHLFEREQVKIDVLAVDNIGRRADTTTVPPAHTVQVPGGTQAMRHVEHAVVVAEGREGHVPLPAWEGALVLKSRAALSFAGDRDKHLQDVALLLGLPVDVPAAAKAMDRSERKYIRHALEMLDTSTWRAVSRAIDERVGRAAAALLS
jgi:predicted nucleotidyltransferase